jgi:multicomponent Na+:H+ antiporter subunit G
MSLSEIATVILMLLGGTLFLAGTVGILRFPDAYTRLHALTKADNLGLGLIAAGLALQADSLAVAAKLAGVWLLAIVASATSCYLIAGSGQHGEATPGGDIGDR